MTGWVFTMDWSIRKIWVLREAINPKARFSKALGFIEISSVV